MQQCNTNATSLIYNDYAKNSWKTVWMVETGVFESGGGGILIFMSGGPLCYSHVVGIGIEPEFPKYPRGPSAHQPGYSRNIQWPLHVFFFFINQLIIFL